MEPAKKSLGQHWLYDADSLNEIVEAAAVGRGELVLEIGAGTGSLTDVLLAQDAQVLALEYDQELSRKLITKYKNKIPEKISIISDDVRTFDFSSLPKNYKIAANIPYYLTAYLLRILTDTANKPEVAALLVQKEVAERIAAQPGKLSLIAVAVQFYYEVLLGRVIKAEMFTPPPKVDSQILIMKRRAKPLFDVNPKSFLRLIKIGFSQPRKTLENNLSSGLHLNKDQAAGILLSSKINPKMRAQALMLEQWHELYLQTSKKQT